MKIFKCSNLKSVFKFSFSLISTYVKPLELFNFCGCGFISNPLQMKMIAISTKFNVIEQLDTAGARAGKPVDLYQEPQKGIRCKPGVGNLRPAKF